MGDVTDALFIFFTVYDLHPHLPAAQGTTLRPKWSHMRPFEIPLRP